MKTMERILNLSNDAKGEAIISFHEQNREMFELLRIARPLMSLPGDANWIERYDEIKKELET